MPKPFAVDGAAYGGLLGVCLLCTFWRTRLCTGIL
jgi:hypothetical protein